MTDNVIVRNLRRVTGLQGVEDASPDSPDSLGNDQGTILQTAQRIDVPTPGGLAGPRGRDWSGERVTIPAGVPATMIPGGGHPERFTPKEDAHPFGKPPLVTRVPWTSSLLGGGTNVLLDQQCGHPVRGVVLDNYSNIYLYVPAIGLYVPPYCARLSTSCYTAPGQWRVLAEAPPGFVQPALTAGTGFLMNLYEEPVTESAGFLITVHP